MAKKRTLQPFYGKPEQRHEQNINLVQQRMIAAGANTLDIDAALKYGRAELQLMVDRRKTVHREALGVGARRLSGTTRSSKGPYVPKRKLGERANTGFGDG